MEKIMNSPEKSTVSYRAALTIFAAVVLIFMVAGFFPAKASTDTASVQTPSAKQDVRSGFSLKEWQLLAKSL
jgi:hypothetical protein